MRGEETVDELVAYGLKVIQPLGGYRFSLDPLLLCHFAVLPEGGNIVDLGTGSGVIPLIIARRTASTKLVGVEMQSAMTSFASRNVELNELADRITIMTEDILALRRRFPVSSFDLVLSNPPYRKRGTGRISPKAGRDDARHESTASLRDFLSVAKYLVKSQGRICFIHHPSRLAEFMAEAVALKLAPLRLRMVHGTPDAEARMFLLELAKGRGGELEVLPPLVVRGADFNYTAEVAGILGE